MLLSKIRFFNLFIILLNGLRKKLDSQIHLMMKPIDAFRLKIQQDHIDIMTCIDQSLSFHYQQQEMNSLKAQGFSLSYLSSIQLVN